MLLAHVVTTRVMVIHMRADTVLSHASAAHYLVQLPVHPVFLHGEPRQFSQRQVLGINKALYVCELAVWSVGAEANEKIEADLLVR